LVHEARDPRPRFQEYAQPFTPRADSQAGERIGASPILGEAEAAHLRHRLGTGNFVARKKVDLPVERHPIREIEGDAATDAPVRRAAASIEAAQPQDGGLRADLDARAGRLGRSAVGAEQARDQEPQSDQQFHLLILHQSTKPAEVTRSASGPRPPRQADTRTGRPR
jgi:hypothetical protein